jgi:4-hydroxybenzoate polyprenyltransferase
MPPPFHLSRIARIYNTLSMDIVLGALATGIMAVRITGTSPGWAWWVVLALAVWFIYTADHLLDAVRGNPDHFARRHRFHYDQRKYLLISLIIIATIALILALTCIDARIIFFGFVLGGVILLYQMTLLVSGKLKSFVQKEFAVAAIYVAGIWGGPLILQGGSISSSQWLVILAYFFLATSDLLLLSFYDEERDRMTGFKSFPVQFGSPATRRWIIGLLFSASAIGLVILFLMDDPVYIVAGVLLIIMAALLGSMTWFISFFSKHDRIRYLNELVFVIPAFMLFF